MSANNDYIHAYTKHVVGMIPSELLQHQRRLVLVESWTVMIGMNQLYRKSGL